MSARERVDALRGLMRRHGIAAYLVPSADPHQNEYVPSCWERRKWLSGFTGSAGDLVVTRDEAGLWTDGRYFLQAARELKGSGIRLHKSGEPGILPIPEYLARTLNEGEAVGVDLRVVSHETAGKLESALKPVGARIQTIDENLADAIWEDRPSPSLDAIELLPSRFTGESVASKLRRLRKAMKERKARAHVLSSLDTIAWLYNIRGRDVDFNPLVISYALVTETEAVLFVDPRKVPAAVAEKLAAKVTVRPYDEAADALRELAAKKARVWVDGSTASRWIVDLLGDCDLIADRSPVVFMKAKKNPVEVAGMRTAHIRDGVAMVRFLHWLGGAVPRGGVTEVSAAGRLEAFRAEGEHYRGLSFRTISGYAEHGAVIHYSVSPETDVPLRPEGVYLIDSGGQYLDGTTDITRTVFLGRKVPRTVMDRYTRVLKGHIALASAGFPAGVKGIQIDLLARLALWEAGLDYKHGTGHGVGAYLCVHEGPQSINPAKDTGAALEPGNILSNEPGFYEAGSYGLRIENLILVTEEPKRSKQGTPFLQFETLTLCPIDTRMVEVGLLEPHERKWLNDYHRRVFRTLGPLLAREDRVWLGKVCAPV